MEVPDSPPPAKSEAAALCLLEASKAAGSLGWRSLRSYIIYYCSSTTSLAYTHIQEIYAGRQL